MPIWPFWSFGIPLSFLIILFYFVFFYSKILVTLRRHDIFVYSLAYVLFFIVYQMLTSISIAMVVYLVAFLLLVSMDEIEMKRACMFTTNILFYVLIFSFPFWFAYKFLGLSLPVYDYIDISNMKGDYCVMNNYIFFVTNSIDNGRFYSLFDEPGVLGCLSSAVLLLNKYDFTNKKLLFIFFSCVFTYSLFFILSTAVLYLVYSLLYFKKNRFLYVVFALLIFGSTVYFFLFDNELFQQIVVHRLINFEESGISSRNSYATNMAFEKFLDSNNLLLGLGSNYQNILGFVDGNSYKLLIFEYGLVGVLLLLCSYILILRRNWKFMILYFLFVLLFFTQRSGINAVYLMFLSAFGYSNYNK